MRSFPLAAAAAAIVLLAAGAGWTAASRRSVASTAVPHDVSVATARVTRQDLASTDTVDGALGYAPGPPIINRLPGTYTAMPAEGDVVGTGGALYAVDGEPVLLLSGAVPAWRPFRLGMSDGPDVAELEAGLRSRGMANGLLATADDHFDAAAAAAVTRWQLHAGLPTTGTLELGRVAFLPGRVRVGPHHAEPGAPAQPGEAPYDATGTDRVVSVALDATRQGEAVPGAAARIDLPDGRSIAGHVVAVGRVAAPPAQGGQGGDNQPGTPQVAVTVRPDDPASTGTIDQEPVQVELTVDVHRSVLTVPVTALVAVGQDGEAVELAGPRGVRRMVPVTAGLSAGGTVEVSGPGLVDGMTVVVAR